MPDAEGKLVTGDVVRIRELDHGDFVVAKVLLASGNGKSVMLELSEPLGAGGGVFLNMVPLIIDYDNETVESLGGADCDSQSIKGQGGRHYWLPCSLGAMGEGPASRSGGRVNSRHEHAAHILPLEP